MGQIIVEKGADLDVDELMLAVAEAGGDDIEVADDEALVWTAPGDVAVVRKGLTEQGLEVRGADLVMNATNPSAVETSDAKKVMRLIDRLEESDDVQTVYHTMDLTDEQLNELEED
jgi:transcriptional/translational regulatory protein YebC/TACO1